jgi:hypothetical protein
MAEDSGQRAVAVAAAFKPGLVILDLMEAREHEACSGG